MLPAALPAPDEPEPASALEYTGGRLLAPASARASAPAESSTGVTAPEKSNTGVAAPEKSNTGVAAQEKSNTGVATPGDVASR